LAERVDPAYPPEAAAQHITGTVRVYFVISADGVVYNAHAISGEGLSNDQNLRKAAERAAIQWRTICLQRLMESQSKQTMSRLMLCFPSRMGRLLIL
jgi:TonB family protein